MSYRTPCFAQHTLPATLAFLGSFSSIVHAAGEPDVLLADRVAATTPKYVVTGRAGTGGTVSPSYRVVDKGKKTTFTIVPKTGYNISGVTGCGGKLSGAIYTTGVVTAPCRVQATFAQKIYAVKATAGIGGTIAPASRAVKHGAKTSFSVKANSGYRVDTVTGCNGRLSGTTYITGAITADCKVEAQFAPALVPKYTLSVSGTEIGEMDWNFLQITLATENVAPGTKVPYTVVAESGDITVDDFYDQIF